MLATNEPLTTGRRQRGPRRSTSDDRRGLHTCCWTGRLISVDRRNARSNAHRTCVPQHGRREVSTV